METVAIGKLIIDNTETSWNCPHFHIVVFKEEDDSVFSSFCLELGVDAYANNAEDSFEKLITSSVELLNEFDKESLFDHLFVAAESTANDPFWKEYRIAEIKLAMNARDLGNKTIAALEIEIERLRNELNKKHNPSIIESLTFKQLHVA